MKKEDRQEMRKPDAAKYGGCSVRSLGKYTKQGRLGVRYERSKATTVAIYSRAAHGRQRAHRELDLDSAGPVPHIRIKEVKEEVKRIARLSQMVVLFALVCAAQDESSCIERP